MTFSVRPFINIPGRYFVRVIDPQGQEIIFLPTPAQMLAWAAKMIGKDHP